MISGVTSIIIGVLAALIADAPTAGQLPVAAAATVGILVTVVCAAAFGWHQAHRWRVAEASVPIFFPA